jgi:hypothetical protein
MAPVFPPATGARPRRGSLAARERRDAHLKSPAFLDVEQFPTIACADRPVRARSGWALPVATRPTTMVNGPTVMPEDPIF